jgi:hypothetical protein
VAPHIRNFGTTWRSVVSLTPWSLNPRGKNLRCPFKVDPRAGVDVLEKVIVVLFMPGLKARIVQPVAGRCPVFRWRSAALMRVWRPRIAQCGCSGYAAVLLLLHVHGNILAADVSVEVLHISFCPRCPCAVVSLS